MKFLFFLLLYLVPYYSYAETSPISSNESISLIGDNKIRPFHSDLCTGIREGPKSNPWLWAHCCIEHDLFYWAGGSAEYRKKADQNLKLCIADRGHPRFAKIVYSSVRLGRYSPFYVRDQHWGNAWSKRRNYRLISAEDIRLIEVDLKNYDDINYFDFENMKERLLSSLKSQRSQTIKD